MSIVLDRLIEQIQTRVGDQQKQHTDEIKDYIKETALELSQRLDNSITERISSDIAVNSTTNEFDLPDNIGQVIGVFNGINEFDLIDLREFQVRGVTSDPRPSVKIIQNINKWKGILLGNSAASTTVDVVYRLRADDITVIPDMYREVASLGAETRYHLRHSSLDKFREFNSRFTEAKKFMFEDLERNTRVDHRFHTALEVESSRSLRSSMRNNEIDYR